MVYILGVKINDNILIIQGISKIFGIGNTISRKICNEFGFLCKLKVLDLSHLDWISIELYIKKKKYIIENDLKQKLKLSILNIINSKNYKGTRHSNGLPVRGQRTRSNGSTQKKLFISRLSKRNYSLYRFKKPLKNKKLLILSNKSINNYNNNLMFIYNKPLLNKKIKYLITNKFNFFCRFKKNKLKRYKKKKIKYLLKNFKPRYQLYIFSKYSNIFLYLLFKGKLIKSLSGGMLNLSGKQKGSPFSARLIMDNMFKFLKFLKIKRLIIYKSGKGSSKKITLRRLFRYKKFLKIFKIKEVVNLAHGGTRLKKKKR